MVRPAGIEPATLSLEGWLRHIHELPVLTLISRFSLIDTALQDFYLFGLFDQF